MSILTYMGIGIALLFGLAAIMYFTTFRNPTYLDDIKIQQNTKED